MLSSVTHIGRGPEEHRALAVEGTEVAPRRRRPRRSSEHLPGTVCTRTLRVPPLTFKTTF